MILLYHFFLSPGARRVRLLLAEKKLPFKCKVEKYWQRNESFLALNPAGTVPVMLDADGTRICGSQVICEYLAEMYDDTPSFLGVDAVERAEVRRLVAWFDEKFQHEISDILLAEKVMKSMLRKGQPSATALRASHRNIHTHLAYITWLVERRSWLAGEAITLADFAAAAQISCVDYLGDIPWIDYPKVKDWYVRIKSRPSFRPLLRDQIAGLFAPSHYADLDF